MSRNIGPVGAYLMSESSSPPFALQTPTLIALFLVPFLRADFFNYVVLPHPAVEYVECTSQVDGVQRNGATLE